MARMIGRAWIGALMLVAGGISEAGASAASAPRVPKDAPFCVPAGTAPIFVAPMGELFRAAAGQPYPSRAWFAAADANGDGVLGRAEMVADADRFFRRLDLNGDGHLSPDEVAAYERAVAPEIGSFANRREQQVRPTAGGLFGGGGDNGYGGPMGAGRFSWLNVPEPVASADLDIDRMVSEAEFAAAAGRRFDALDRAGTGELRLAALPRTPQQAAIEGPCRPRPAPRRGAKPDDDGLGPYPVPAPERTSQ